MKEEEFKSKLEKSVHEFETYNIDDPEILEFLDNAEKVVLKEKIWDFFTI